MDKFQELLVEQNELHTIYDYINNGDELSNDMLEKLSNLCSDRMYEIDGQLDAIEFEAVHGTGLIDECPVCKAYMLDVVIVGEERVKSICPLCYGDESDDDGSGDGSIEGQIEFLMGNYGFDYDEAKGYVVKLAERLSNEDAK